MLSFDLASVVTYFLPKTITRLDVQSAEEKNDEQDRLGLDDADSADAEKSPLVVMFEGIHSRHPLFHIHR